MMTFVTSSLAIVAATAVIGIAGAVSMTTMLALPPFLSLPAEAPRTAAGMFTISYTCAIVIPRLQRAVGPDWQTVDRFRAALFVRRCAGRAWHGRDQA